MKVPTNVAKLIERMDGMTVQHGEGKAVFVVDSDHSRHYVRRGDSGEFFCDCAWAAAGNRGCAHELAARKAFLTHYGWTMKVWGTYAEAKRQRRPVKVIAGDNGVLFITIRKGKNAHQRIRIHNDRPVLRPVSLVVGRASEIVRIVPR